MVNGGIAPREECNMFFLSSCLFFNARPLWISPRQAVVVPVGSQFDDYANKVQKQLYAAGIECEVDLDPGTTLNKKIRNNQLAQFNFILGSYI